ncbi:phosphotransferase [Paenibacillus sp. GCM10027626]|uniref:phosphotransferase n=1 Tax=Paenibacillus sp. GCM10027626 TaxID=3273411 RepID=UPI0036276515
METSIGNVDWIDRTETLDALLKREAALSTHPMDQGFEAEVIKLNSANESYVLKVWNKCSKPDIRFQYHLLNVLHESDIPVSRPVGWGINANLDKVLLTTFDGEALIANNAVLKNLEFKPF